MSRDAVEQILGKAMLEPEFRNMLFTEPDAALQGFELSDEERAALSELDAVTLESAAGTLDERISKSMIGLPPTRTKYPSPIPPPKPPR